MAVPSAYDKKQVDLDIGELALVFRFAEEHGYDPSAREALFRLKTVIREMREALKER